MAAASEYIIAYTGAASIVAGETYKPSTILADPTDNVLIMTTSGVQVSISGTVKFPIPTGEVSFADKTDSTTTYVFDKDCVIAYGRLENAV